MDGFWLWATLLVVGGGVFLAGVLFIERRLSAWELKASRPLPADRKSAPVGTSETQPAEPQRSGRLDIGDLAHDPGVGSVGDRPWVRARMSNGDMFALGFYGGLGFAVGTALVWLVLFSVLIIPFVLALAGSSR